MMIHHTVTAPRSKKTVITPVTTGAHAAITPSPRVIMKLQEELKQEGVPRPDLTHCA